MAGSDTIMVGEPSGVKLPLLRPEAQFTAPEEYVVVELNKITSSALTLKEIADKKFKVENAKIVAEQIGRRSRSSCSKLKNVRFTIDEPNDAMLAVLKAIMNEDKPFNGGVSYGSVPTERAGTMREKLNIGRRREDRLHPVRRQRHHDPDVSIGSSSRRKRMCGTRVPHIFFGAGRGPGTVGSGGRRGREAGRRTGRFGLTSRRALI